MLSVKDLVKVYKTKGGTEVRALDGVTVDFPEKGMVFLLGRSGSGKSTLLNVAGGLDKPDSGEVIVKGKSSKDFSGSDFDSYRNTFVGFVFQEYNILNEFNIEQNIALALQLQGKKNDKAAVNALLEQVDLVGMGKRKPNTLSGGQKQRVAIARALIKEPEIIMADEPTGALDSNTGKQVLDTLKKLSETKLVIIVSHDREFAEQYGDRVIELKDGKILSDSSKAYAAPTAVSANVNAIGEDTVRVKDWGKLTQEEFNSIYTMLKGKGGEVIITSSESDMPAVKRACKITDDGKREYFKDTAPGSVETKSYDGSKTKFIKSHLPVGHAVKMGASGLKTKPIRLFFTILISIISFTMFGVLSTMMMYDSVYSISEALRGTGYSTAMLEKTYHVVQNEYRVDSNGNRELQYTSENDITDRISAEELAAMNDNGRNIKFAGVFGKSNYSYNNYLGNQSSSSDGAQKYYPSSDFIGFSDCGETFMSANNFVKLAGDYPTEANEIAVSEYVYNQFKDKGFRSTNGSLVQITDYDKLIGMELNVFNSYYDNGNALKIVGIYNVGDLSKYKSILDGTYADKNSKEYKVLEAECRDEIAHGFHSLAFVSDTFYDKHSSTLTGGSSKYIETRHMYGVRARLEKDDYYNENISEYDMCSYYSEKTVRNNASEFTVYSKDGTLIDCGDFSLGENDAYVNIRYLSNAARSLANASRNMERFYDNDGNVVYDARDGWSEESSGFWTNYAGDVSFTEVPGYVYAEEREMYIHKNGDSASYFDIINMYEQRECYMDRNGEYTSIRPDVDHLLYGNYGTYYSDGNGNYSTERKDGWEELNGDYYHLGSDSSVDPGTVYVEIKDGYYVGDVYLFVNVNDPTEIVGDRFDNWRSINGYYVYADGRMSSFIEDGYNSRGSFYFDSDTGELSLEYKNGYENYNGFYIDEEGNASVDYPENGDYTYKKGIYINADGDLSFTKKPGYVFRSEWLYNSEEHRVLFAKKYYGCYVNDSTGEKGMDPAYALSYDGSTWVSYRDLNRDFGDAVDRLLNTTGDNYGEPNDAGTLNDGDIAFIVNRIEEDWSTWKPDDDKVLPEKFYIRNRNNSEKELDIKGYYVVHDSGSYETLILSSSFASSFSVFPSPDYYEWETEYVTDYVAPANLKYNYIIAGSASLADDIYFMLEDKPNSISYKMYGNTVYSDAKMAINMIETMSIVFLIIGLVMAVLSALMLFNFISTSISVKRKEIGVLRAVGARGTDVFKIFFAEAFIIAMICFVISAIASGVLCIVLNGVFAGAINLSVLNYGPVQILLILGISVVVAFVATILPVFFAAKKPPVESIRAL